MPYNLFDVLPQSNQYDKKLGEYMIIEAFLAVLKFIIIGVISLLPALPQIRIDYLDGVFQALSTVDMVINIRVLASCLAILFLFMNVKLIWAVIMWVVKKIPGLN